MWIDSSSTTSSSISSSVVWDVWSGDTVCIADDHAQVWVETEDMRQARLAREERSRIEAEERAERERRVHEKALELLMLSLTEEQRNDWRENNGFDVISQSGKRFRIHNGRSMNVNEYDGNGRIVSSHCIVPQDYRIPTPDMFVAQMLMLMYNESEFMRTANHRHVQ